MALRRASPTCFRPEVELLLCCARTTMTVDCAVRLRALIREDVDWAYLIETARQHKMLLLLYWHLHATCKAEVPEAILVQLRDAFHTSTLRRLVLTGALLNILRLFECHHIVAIPYKGPVLAASAYGDHARLRQYRDLDLLVHQRDVLRAKDLLISQGSQSMMPLNGAKEGAYLHRKGAYTYNVRDRTSQAKVELHWHLTPAFPLDLTPLWERLEPVSLDGATVRGFSREASLLILCIHGSDHLWCRLQMICDVATLLRVHQAIDWTWVMQQAEAQGSMRMLLLGLCLARDLLGTTLPEAVVHKLEATPIVRSLAGQLRQRLFQEASGPPGVMLQFRMRERWQDKAWYGLYYVQFYLLTPHPEDRVLMPLPRVLFPLYYILRPLRLVVGRYGLRRLQHLLGFS